ncbi:MAG TPA: hypothetical protein VGN63_22975 [Flavisolibacter sp.]|nr:hypothetical protein [Flavisolibacter sp.]
MEQTKKAPLDILNVLEDQSERILVLEGSEKVTDKPRVACSNCEITFANESDLLACIEALKQSDEQMRQRPQEQVLYNWKRTYRVGMKLLFGVVWYDREFFERRKEAYKSNLHVSIFERFGIVPENFKIEHVVL